MKRGIISSLGFLVVMQKKGNSTLRTSYLLLREIVSFLNKRNTTVFSVLPLYNSIIAKNIYSQKGFQKINACQPFFHSPCLSLFFVILEITFSIIQCYFYQVQLWTSLHSLEKILFCSRKSALCPQFAPALCCIQSKKTFYMLSLILKAGQNTNFLQNA